jgi:hypothetical protein
MTNKKYKVKRSQTATTPPTVNLIKESWHQNQIPVNEKLLQNPKQR